MVGDTEYSIRYTKAYKVIPFQGDLHQIGSHWVYKLHVMKGWYLVVKVFLFMYCSVTHLKK